MNFKEKYDIWRKQIKDPILKSELDSIATDDDEIASRFASDLQFGTAGVRGLMGVGSNRINFVTIAHISAAFSTYLVQNFQHPSVVISYDTRKFSYEFAKISLEVLSYYGIIVHFFASPQPVGLLSFAIRNLKCSGGIMITASHNPPEYNGYKIYNSYGAQPINVDKITKILSKISAFDVQKANFKKGLCDQKILFINDSVKQMYIESIKSKIKFEYFKSLNLTYSPLNGCAGEIFCKMFKNVRNFHVVRNQQTLDDNFGTCKHPDPQNPNAFNLSLKLAKQNKSDIIILNDPDGDRIGVSLKFNDNYKIFSGIETAALIINFLINVKKLNFIIAKSVVTGGLAKPIMDFYGMECQETLPGFKYIANFMNMLEFQGNLNKFALGFEESNGILMNTDIRDKDGVSSAAFICEMVSYYKKNNTNCIDILYDLYKKFGYHLQKNVSIKENDQEKINKKISKFKKYFIENREKITSIEDYRFGEKMNFSSNSVAKLDFPYANMVCANFDKNDKLFIRASGTEPLLKYYIIYSDKTLKKAEEKCKKIEEIVDCINEN